MGKNKTELVYCPVMVGVPVNKEEAKEKGRIKHHRGKLFYLCCDSCITMFEMNPQQYAK